MAIVFFGIASLLFAFAAALSSVRALHLLQLESYQLDGYARARKRQKIASWMGLDFLFSMLGISVVSLLAYLLTLVFVPAIFSPEAMQAASPVVVRFSDTSSLAQAVYALGAAVLQAFTALLVYRNYRKSKQKKPIVFTKRLKRLFIALVLVNLCIAAVLVFFSGILSPVLLGLLPALQGELVIVAALLASPVEKHINMTFFRDAQRILRERDDLIKIGITGSYGKTSNKFILAGILSERYDVLATPSSFNTPMGLTRVIREQLRPNHQVFLAEMGARHVGDIAELCELVRPTIGMLTSIGPQHLETFHSIENVAATKFELIDALSENGNAFLSGQVAEDFPNLCAAVEVPAVVAGFSGACGVRAEDMETHANGSTFMLRFPGEEPFSVHTKLLGKHNIGNIVLCCAVAKHLGLTNTQIAMGVAKLQPVEHRLQLIHGMGGNIVIDDAFNSNPAGAKAALDVLAAFPGRKLVVTPGMVELGEREVELNRAFGAQIADVADVTILIGKARTQPIADGLRGAGVSSENVHVVATLDEAAALLMTIAAPGDVTLFENDLPDHYEE